MARAARIIADFGAFAMIIIDTYCIRTTMCINIKTQQIIINYLILTPLPPLVQ